MVEPITVAIHGSYGKMGQEMLMGLCESTVTKVVGVADQRVESANQSLPDGSGLVPSTSNITALLDICNPQVVIDFTNSLGALTAVRASALKGVNIVIGSTGLGESDLNEIKSLCKGYAVGVVIAPNFALGAVLLTHLARQVARFFQYVDIVEMHHEAKIDAPSGTALALAEALNLGQQEGFLRPQPEKEPLPGTRGASLQGVSIHSIRMPGRLAHHEVIFGTQGQTLTLRHDTISRACYMPGVIAAIQHVVQFTGLTVGLESILGLSTEGEL